MKKLLAVLVFVAFCLVDTLAQLKVREDGRINLCYETANNGANAALYLGSYIHPDHPGEDNGLFTIEVLSDYGSLNICRDWPNPNWKNFLICIESNYDVGIGKTPSYTLDVDGDIATYGTLRVASDGRLKTNVKSLSEEPSKIYSLEAKAYQKTTPEVDDTELCRQKGVPESAISSRKSMKKASSFEYGFIAQELKEVFPELVTQDKEGYYSINYIGLIPLMVEALKEQNARNEAQQAEIDSLKRAVLALTKESNLPHIRSAASPGDGSTALQTPAVAGCRLEQNTPNPFSQSTQIKYYLPETIISAYLCIYDMQGKQLRQIALTQRGEGAELISASQLAPGMYLYALIADGQEVDVKRMILTE